MGEEALGDGPSLVLAADAVGDGDANVGEKGLVEVGLVGDLLDRFDADAGGVHRRDEEGDAALLFVRLGVGAGEDEDHVGFVGAAGPDFLAIEDVIVAVAFGTKGKVGQVRAGVGLGIALAPELFRGGDLGQVALLLLVVAVFDHHGADHVDAHVGAGRALAAGLLAEDHLLGERPAGAAGGLGP
jgi:hypothetical protein